MDGTNGNEETRRKFSLAVCCISFGVSVVLGVVALLYKWACILIGKQSI